MRKIIFSPWPIILLLTIGLAVGMYSATPLLLDDHFYYQKFINTLAGGKFDLSILGFHGSDILAVPFHWIRKSPISQIEFQALCSLLLPLLAFLAGKSLFRSNIHGILLSVIITMMPFISFVYLRGWTGSSYMCLMLLTIYGASTKAKWTWLAWSFAILTKPFAFALFPLIVTLTPKSKSIFKRWKQVILGLSVVLTYLIIQYIQAGHIVVGTHSGVTEINVLQGPIRMLMNTAHSLQILFSVHNYYYPNPALTGAGNMMHTTPILIFLGLFNLLAPTKDSSSRSLNRALLAGALIGIGMNIPLDHMDHFYMQAGILIMIIAAIPMLIKYPIWIPIVLATLHFQWLYFYLQFQNTFQIGNVFFTVPLIVDILFLLYCLLNYKKIINGTYSLEHT
ncbi:MAG: hypothetical protein KAS32_04365 [Candidatus Peribacteraceae bacterium]|nr:hypothetical protein [Candidatus Peribacteraceae bacterium]